MRRQVELGGASPVGSSRIARLDPLALPVRFTANDAAADQQVRHVEVNRDRVILRRAVQGMRIALNVPVAAFLGVSIRLKPAEAACGEEVVVAIEHRDPALSIPLYAADNSNDVVAEWQLWGRVLGLPLLVAGSDGTLREPFPRMGGVRLKETAPRRRRRTALKGRRPLFLVRRRRAMKREPLVHRDEREIIARS